MNRNIIDENFNAVLAEPGELNHHEQVNGGMCSYSFRSFINDDRVNGAGRNFAPIRGDDLNLFSKSFTLVATPLRDDTKQRVCNGNGCAENAIKFSNYGRFPARINGCVIAKV